MNALNYRHINLQKINEDTFGDTSILKMVIELFIEDIDEYVEILNEELKNKNWQELFQATHKIKPSISMFGISVLEPVVLKLERDFKYEENLDDIDALVSQVKTTLNQVKIELHTELKSMNIFWKLWMRLFIRVKTTFNPIKIELQPQIKPISNE